MNLKREFAKVHLELDKSLLRILKLEKAHMKLTLLIVKLPGSSDSFKRELLDIAEELQKK